MKVVELTTAIGQYLIKESVEDIKKLRSEVEETGDLDFTILNTKDHDHEGYKASVISALYRGVREVERKEDDLEIPTEE